MNNFARAFPFIYTGVIGIALVLFVAATQSTSVRQYDSSSAASVPSNTCRPRPACLDATPACKIAEPAGGWCATGDSGSGTVCAQDMVMCPDGSYAPRDPNNYCLPKCGLPSPKASCVPRPSWCDRDSATCARYGINWCPAGSVRPTTPSRTLPPYTVPPRTARPSMSVCPTTTKYEGFMCPNGASMQIDPVTCRPNCPPIDEF